MFPCSSGLYSASYLVLILQQCVLICILQLHEWRETLQTLSDAACFSSMIVEHDFAEALSQLLGLHVSAAQMLSVTLWRPPCSAELTCFSSTNVECDFVEAPLQC